ncbi:MAG TPA: M1 family metallopeptidase [Edaphocola sp.]|nr:M1 family metallopeptidase [Edaphocola sp.]
MKVHLHVQFIICLLLFFCFGFSNTETFAQSDSLVRQCTNNPDRSWWDVIRYQLAVDFTDTTNDTIRGLNIISARVGRQARPVMQIDLDTPMHIEKVLFRGRALNWTKEGSAYLLNLKGNDERPLAPGDTFSVKIYFSGRPQDAQNAPWDGGFVRRHDSAGHLWWAVACQGQGASLWFPCKNFQGDEPDSGVTEHYTILPGLTAIGNGRLSGKNEARNGATTFSWQVVNPINNYDITFYIGDYEHWADTFQGQKGKLDLDYYVLRKNFVKAHRQFQQVKTMLSCFESHFGPYPFYKDGYKLVEAPYLGMEHQSAVAYGNHFYEGYLGKDRSATGVGLLFDFIIVHESAHEWFGNSITSFDKADEWIHEGFASYAETVYAECIAGKEKAFEYQQGKRRTIRNDKPVEGRQGQCDEGSSDAYDKAGFMIHTVRMIMNNDTAFFDMLKAMNQKYEHRLVTGKQIESFISSYAHMDFTKMFDQYLRQAKLPVLALKKQPGGTLTYYWKDCVPGFDMPVYWLDGIKKNWLYPTTTPQTTQAKDLKNAGQLSKDFLINVDWRK